MNERKAPYISKIPHFITKTDGEEDDEYVTENTQAVTDDIRNATEAITKLVFNFLKFSTMEFELDFKPEMRYNEDDNEMFVFIDWQIFPIPDKTYIKKMRICRWVYV